MPAIAPIVGARSERRTNEETTMDAVTPYRELDEVLAGFQGLRMLAEREGN